MAKVIRTLDFLPEIFQTPSNQQFLSATLDQLVNPPDLQKLQGFVGNRFGYGVNANDYYVTEPDATRTNYQLDPGVVFTKPGTSTATDFISYPGILNAINAAGGLANNNSRLFNSQFYSWDSFTNLDPLINFNQYYWLPEGPPAVTVAAATVFSAEDYVVTAEANGYSISVLGSGTSSINPTITLLRGGVYNFYVNQSTQFWIQGLPGVSGTNPTNPNQSVRLAVNNGVDNNGAETGIVTFTVPAADAQNQYILPGNNLVSLVSNIPYENLNGQLVSTIKNIDGATNLRGSTVMFYNTETPVNTNFYRIDYVGDPNNPTISLSLVGAIPVNQNINIVYGNTYGGLTFYLDTFNNIEPLPYISAPLDTLYYQDGSDPTRVGMIRIIESNVTNQLDINTEVLGQKNFTSTNGVVFTNGLKVQFNGDVVPSSYLSGQYYIAGVGTAIELLPVSDFIVPEPFTGDILTPWDSTNWDIGNFSDTLYIPTYPDYITIARNSINRNPWARSNRWFHIDVINATAQYNNDPTIATAYARQDNKAARPIIEFYPNLELFNYGSVGVNAVDFIDFRTTDCLNLVAGQPAYYPDVDVYTAYNSNIFNPIVPTVGFTTPSLMGGINVANMRAVAISPTGVYVAVGYGTANSALYSVSTDGINWTTPASMNGVVVPAASMNSVTVNSAGLFVAVGGAGYPYYATSTDGINWTTPALMNGSSAYTQMRSVTVNSSGLFVAVGSDGSTYPLYATSTDGTNWTTPAIMNGSTSFAAMQAVTVNSSGLFVAVGYDGNQYPVYATSVDGSTWTTPTPMNSTTNPVWMLAVTVNSSGLFVAIGTDINTGYPVYSTSTTGSNWITPVAMTGSASGIRMTAVSTNYYGLFVAVGYDQNTVDGVAYRPVYSTSLDGSTWTTPAFMNNSIDPANIYGVAVDTIGGFVAVGDSGASGVVSKSVVQLPSTSTTVTVPASSVTGTLEVGMYINDSQNMLPPNTQITSIINNAGVLYIEVSWPNSAVVSGIMNVSLVADPSSNTNYALFPGARVIFAADPAQKAKIFVVNFSTVTQGSPPVITLAEAPDGQIVAGNVAAVIRGYNYQGYSFWYNGTAWVQAQQKITTNQAPLFDVFDSNGISFGNPAYYVGTSFKGSRLFSYAIGTGITDKVLGFPLSYSSVNNIGDISFDVSFNSDTFTYVNSSSPVTEKVNTGFVYNTESLTDHTRLLGWQTAVGPSVQYQVFEFNYVRNYVVPNNAFLLDVAPVASDVEPWPVLEVYVNNVLQPSTNYTVTTTSDSTTVVINIPNQITNTLVQILVLSDQVSKYAFYQIPINLSNNPFNTDITVTNVGDIRRQYASIFNNCPNTTGHVFGSNNYRDLGNLVPYGNVIIQNSASLALPAAFLRNLDFNIFDALAYNSKKYVEYKNLIVYTVNSYPFDQRYDPAYVLNTAIDLITAAKDSSQSFFWSDMIPAKAPYASNVYTFKSNLDRTVYPLTQTYNFKTANYNGVLVYLSRTISGLTTTKQLVINQDYTVSTTAPSLEITIQLLAGDVVTVNEYNQTYGSYVPNTPTKLGLYPAFIPGVVLDTGYQQPTYFIKGHDGSYNKLYGDYIPETDTLVDFRDQALLEFEKRVYNNLKLSNVIPIQAYEVTPGFFRTTDYSYDEWLEIYTPGFLNWVGQNKLDYKQQYYNSYNQYTWNYKKTTNKVDNSVVDIGYWRGVYSYFYDTTTPDTTPWEMLGYKNEPSWWTDRYGPAPYTSNNLVLWGDLAAGLDWNNGNPVVIPKAVRNGLLKVLPVDSQGNLVPPFQSVVANYYTPSFETNWIVGDDGPVEFSYRRSSSWPFDLMRILALTKPAEFFNLGAWVDNYKYSEEFNQYLVGGRSHLVPNEIPVYGSGTPVTSYINWVVDYRKQYGVDATTAITTLINNLDVRLVYRLAGFSDQNLLNFYIQSTNPNSNNSSLLIPNESYQVLLYSNPPYGVLQYSSVIVQITNQGQYAVFGNSQNSAYFTTLLPKNDGQTSTTKVDSLSVTVPRNFTSTEEIVPYGTIFQTPQAVAIFLASYGAYLEANGATYDYQLGALPINWNQMVSEFLYWVQIGWQPGAITTLNPAAYELTINRENQIVQPLSVQGANFVLNQNLYPIKNADLSIIRNGTQFSVTPLNQGDTISYGQFNLSNFENACVFNNTTMFGDTICDLVTGLRQNRLYLRGAKTASWNGTYTASGFIINQNNVVQWDPAAKYTKGQIVLYKNQYWIAQDIIQPNETFQQKYWLLSNYNMIQTGLLPNSSTNSLDSTYYYSNEQSALNSDTNLLGYSLIGYRQRDYAAIADLTDVTQVNVYQNLIKSKGSTNAVSAFKGATLPHGGIDYNIYENWAILTSNFGGVLNNNFVQFKLNAAELSGNPFIVGLTDGVHTSGVEQEVPLYSLYNYNYSSPPTSPNVLPTISQYVPSTLFPDAGYVNFNDVKMSSYFYSQLPTAVNQQGVIVPLTSFYVGDYVWLANYLNQWNVYTPISLGQVVAVTNNLNNTCTVTFSKIHGLKQYDLIAITNFNSSVNGYYTVNNVVDNYQITILLSLTASSRQLIGQGVGMYLSPQRVTTPSQIANLPLDASEFVKNTVWVDTNSDGGWAVYQKNINYQLEEEITQPLNDSLSFGSSVVYNNNLGGYLIGDPNFSSVYRYDYNQGTGGYDLFQTLTGTGISFGSTIVNEQNIYVVSQPYTDEAAQATLYIYVLNNSVLFDQLELYQDPITFGYETQTIGTSLALSGDTTWLYIGVPALNQVWVYRKENVLTNAEDIIYNQTYTITSLGNTDFTLITNDPIENKVGMTFVANDDGYPSLGTGTATRCTYVYSTAIDASGFLTTGDNFGYSVSTDYYGDTVVIGAPNVAYSTDYQNWGSAYVYERSVQNFIAPYTYPLNSNPAPTFQLAWSPSVDEVYVSVNSIAVQASEYTISGSTLTYTGSLTAGDIINVSGNVFTKVQTLTTQNNPQVGVQFGLSLDTTTHAGEIIVGAPFELTQQLVEGAVYRFTNGGAEYGQVYGTSPVATTATRTILINGFAATIPSGANAAVAANTINQTNIINITASATSDNKLVISLTNPALAQANEKLLVTALNSSALTELGVNTYTQTQVVLCPHTEGPTQFGTVVKFNESGSFVASAPVGTRYEDTTFDVVDYPDQDTIFDNNTTQFIESFPNAGAVYMFDYLGNYNETLQNPGSFVYAQSVNAPNLTYGPQPRYGTAIDFVSNRVVVGTPNMYNYDISATTLTAGVTYTIVFVGTTDFTAIGAVSNTVGVTFVATGPASGSGFATDGDLVSYGQVISYTNSVGQQDWEVYRQTAPIVDTARIGYMQIFSAQTNNTLVNLDYFDPLQDKLLGAVAENIDVISNTDPASYNNGNVTQRALVWGKEHVGNMWFNTSNVRFINYHQDDVVYNSKYWGAVFPGSDVAVYSWVASNNPPANYQGPGTPYNTNLYTIETILNASQSAVPVYYFWVRNTSIIFSEQGKTLSDTVLQSYISSPQNSGISYISPILPNVFSVYNSQQYLNGNDSVLNVGYATGVTNDQYHTEYSLIRENYPDDFLPGLPTLVNPNPTLLYQKLLYSLSGVDGIGQVVPDPFLPVAVQSGVAARPRQSFFLDRFIALQNYIEFANNVMSKYPITEIRENATYLYAKGPFYDTSNYWEFINWWATGYDNSIRSSAVVPFYADLSTLSVAPGTIVKVQSNGAGKSEWYILVAGNVWNRIGLQNGTIQFKSSLWNYKDAGFGWGNNFFDTASFDTYPSEETYWIARALTEQIYTNELLAYRNNSLILLFQYIQSESVSSQNYLTWLNKTSLVDVSHNIRQLLPYENYQSDNQDFLAGYLGEALPYHVFIKEFTYVYTGSNTWAGNVIDFDLPAQYNTTIDQFVSPQLVYSNPDNVYTYLPSSTIWQQPEYYQWFTNYGISLTGETNYLIGEITAYLGLGSSVITVTNASGFPLNGVIMIGEEKIAYSTVNRANNTLTNLVRGYGGTTVSVHFPGENIYIDLPAVLVLNGGRGYTNPPKVTAYIDTSIYPAPSVPAQLEAVMSLDSVVSVNVIDPGNGYAVLPQIIIDYAEQIVFASTNVNVLFSTIQIPTPLLQTGDLVKYEMSPNGQAIGGVENNQWYYVNVLQSAPAVVVALYTTYLDAVSDTNRVFFYNQGSGTGHTLNLGAKASAVSTAAPIRENNITLKFDRTSYNSQVSEWTPNAFYGAFFTGDALSQLQTSSSTLPLSSTQPDINSILTSAHGCVFEIVDTGNIQQVEWSSFVRTVSETIASTNAIRLILSSSTLENASGSTVGMVEGMPVQFNGFVGSSGIVPNTVYYVKEVLSLTDFTISATSGGSVFSLSNQVITGAGLNCLVAQVTNTATLTMNYPGIRNATSVTANSIAKRGYITVPLNSIGTGGTKGMYSGLPVFFVGNVFGGVVANQAYYVTTVLDKQNFTISTSADPYTVQVEATNSSTNYVTLNSTTGLSVNDPIVINEMVVEGQAATSFGNIVPSTIYYVSQIIDGFNITISTDYNGSTFVLSTVSSTTTVTAGSFVTGVTYTILDLGTTDFTLIGAASNTIGVVFVATGAGTGTGTATCRSFATLVSQTNTASLTTAIGDMTINLSLPVSPGQVNGQMFTLYKTSQEYYPITYTVSNELTGSITATIAGVDYAAIESIYGTANFYVNMPLRVSHNIGNLVTATTYYVSSIGVISVAVTATASSTNRLTCNDTSVLYANMPIVFSGTGLGGITISQTYYVKTIVDSTHFTISTALGGTVLTLTSDTGSMTGTGDAYVTLSTSLGGGNVSLSNDYGPVTYTQTPVTLPDIAVNYLVGGYSVTIVDGGQGMATTNVLTVSGTEVGGVSPANDVTIEVNGVDSQGSIVSLTVTGTVPADSQNKYYLKVTGTNTFEVYADPLMLVPVTGIGFPYTGVKSTIVTSTQSPDSIVVSNATGFQLYDPVVFTGNVQGNLVLGKTYYIETISGTTITLSDAPGGTAITGIASLSGTNFTMAALGSFAFLYEPFYFNPSIVKFNNQLYRCIVSNNDPEFVYGKWELLDSGDRRINALDRIVGYYKPTVNMPSFTYHETSPLQPGVSNVDFSQLLTGTTYPNSTYLGNPFQPSQQLPLNVKLQDQPFTATLPPVYDVQGSAFTSGFGPEELVPGIVSDNLSMIVNTLPGSNWDPAQYAHTGYNVVSLQLTPVNSTQTVYSFDGAVQVPAQVAVFVINGATQLSTSIYNSIDYTVNWINNTITLSSPLLPSNTLRIDVYEVGNGLQLVKSSTKRDPIILDPTTGFNGIPLDCNYTGSINNGNGIVRPGTSPIQTNATATISITNSIVVDNISNFILNSPITFQGSTFGNIVAGTIYYVKTISTVTDSITVSTTYDISTGIAGSTFHLSDAVGSMVCIVETGNGVFWSPPVVYHNGNKLVSGTINFAISTSASTKYITCNSTSGLIVNTPIKFSNTMFGGVTPQTTYYISHILDSYKFSISATPGGAPLTLTDAVGGASFITNDYAAALSADGFTAKLVFASLYDPSVDYITYTLFGETVPQYGYTIPETQVFPNITGSSFTLTNYVVEDNPTNAIVEVNGVRQTAAQYTISSLSNTITFNTPPPIGSTVAVTSYNLTDNQYFNTQYGISGSSLSASTTVIVSATTNTVSTYDQNGTVGYDTQLYAENLNTLTLDTGYNTSVFTIGQVIVFSAPTIGGIVAGKNYYIAQIIDSSTFTISELLGGAPIAVTTATGTMTGNLNGITVAEITNISNVISDPLATTTVTGTSSITNLITCASTTNFALNQTVQFEASVISATSIVIGATYRIESLGTTDFTTIGAATNAVGVIFIATGVGTGTGTALLATFGNIDLLGQVYFVKTKDSSTTFSISDQAGNTITLGTDSGSIKAIVGGQPTIRITTGVLNTFEDNTLVRIDGTLGSTQLNNQTFYAKVITTTQFDIYSQPYNPAFGATNSPVTNVSAWLGGGYAWRDGLFTITDTKATAAAPNGLITVNSTTELILGTPVYFTVSGTALGSTIMGGLIAGKEYYVNQIVPGTGFYVTETRGGNNLALTSDTGGVNVTQWQQTNVDRLWVTVNGYRVPSSSLRLNPGNDLSILASIIPGDEVIITSMVPSATPNQMTYYMNVNQLGVPVVYNANMSKTWLVRGLESLDTVIYVNDVSQITETIVQNNIAPAPVDGVISIGLSVDKRTLTSITVYNNTTGQTVPSSAYSVQIVDASPTLLITGGVTTGNYLTITSIQGNLIYINGEQIMFGSVDFVTNTLTQLQRSANGSAIPNVTPPYTPVLGLLPGNKLPDIYYNQTWNPIPGVYNLTEGDPLQIANTAPATFLNTGK